MEELEYLRKEINEIDDILIDCFKKRMEIVLKVADYKIKNSMQVLDKSREDEIINKHISKIEDKNLKCQTKEFLEDLMSISRKAQKNKLNKVISSNNTENIINSDDIKIGFQGVPASFSHEALIEYFGENSNSKHFETFKDVFEALKNKEIKYGVLPIENSSTGGIAEVYDLLRHYGLFIVGEKCIKINHNLIGIEETNISDVKEVYSHTQGFLQCNNFLNEQKSWKLIPYYNTAKSAKYIKNENTKNKVCIASKKAAELYGLKILKENINDNVNNHTRFIIVSRDIVYDSSYDKISIVLVLPHKAGSLSEVLKHFSDNKLNMLKIESRPIENKSWQYFFYIDFEGNLLNENTKKALKDIKNQSLYFKLLGNYKEGN